MGQGVCNLHLRALPIVPVVFQYEVYHPRAVGLEVAVLVAYRCVYLAPCLLCFVGAVVAALPDEDVWRPVLLGTLPVRHGLGRLAECCDGGRHCGFSDRGYQCLLGSSSMFWTFPASGRSGCPGGSGRVPP